MLVATNHRWIFILSGTGTQTDYDRFGTPSQTQQPATDTVDTAPWSGGVNLGTSSRVVRTSSALTGLNVVPGAMQRWTTSLTFKITEVPPPN